MTSQRQLPIIVASLCGLAAVIVVCVTVVMLNRSGTQAPAMQPTATEASVLDQKVSAADSKAFVERRERIRSITGITDADVKRFEKIYEAGAAADWIDLRSRDRAIVCLFREYDLDQDASDMALCLGAVTMEQGIYSAWEKHGGSDVSSIKLKELMPDIGFAGPSELKLEAMKIKPDVIDSETMSRALAIYNRR